MSLDLDLKALAKESVWVEKSRYADAERDYYSNNNSSAAKSTKSDSESRHTQEVTESSVTSRDQRVLNEQKQRKSCDLNTTSIVSDIVRVRKLINKTLDSKEVSESLKAVDNQLADRLKQVELENQTLKKTVNDLSSLVSKLELRVSSLEGSAKQDNKPKAAQNQTVKPAAKPTKQPALSDKKDDDNDSDIDLFGSDEDEEADELKKKRLEEYAAKKSKKPGVIAKSSVILDVKPWDDETDMQKMEEQVRQVQMEGLLWGASKLVPLAYGIKKLQIVTVIEDDKVSVEELTEKLEALEDFVQSVDIAAFNKI